MKKPLYLEEPKKDMFIRNAWRFGYETCRFSVHTKCQSFHYIDHAFPQVQHAKRSQALSHLSPYQSELVPAIIREICDLDKEVSNILTSCESSFNPATQPTTACHLLVGHLCMRRNKRCLLAYHQVRSTKLEEICWSGNDVMEQRLHKQQQVLGQSGPQATAIDSKAGNQSSLSPDDEEYLRQFGDMLAAYKGRWTDIDLTGSSEPPKDLFIDVRVLKNAGDIQTEYGYEHAFTLDLRMLTERFRQSNTSHQKQPVLCSSG